MANPIKRTRKSGAVVWEITVRRKGFPKAFGSFPTCEEAAEFGDHMERSFEGQRRAALDPTSTLPASGRFEDEVLADVIRMFKNSDSCISRHAKLLPTILANIKQVTVGQLRPSWTAAYVARMRKTKTRRKTFFAYESIVAHLHMVNVVLKWRAEQLDLPAPRFVIDTKKLPRDWANKRTRRFEPGEERMLMARLSKIDAPSRPQWALLVQLAIETGARLQEMLYAEWREISPKTEFWTIPAEHTKCKKERVIPLTSGGVEIVEALASIRSLKSERIFHAMGNPLSVSTLFHRWSKSAGLVDFRFHDLRHEGISRFVLTQRNFSVHEIMQMVGHSSPAMLARYSNLRGDELAIKIIRTEKANPPDLSSFGVNRFAHDFAAIRGEAPIAKPAAPIYGFKNGASVYLDARRPTPPTPAA
jgi:integrase